jgi:hypothetical protein
MKASDYRPYRKPSPTTRAFPQDNDTLGDRRFLYNNLETFVPSQPPAYGCTLHHARGIIEDDQGAVGEMLVRQMQWRVATEDARGRINENKVERRTTGNYGCCINVGIQAPCPHQSRPQSRDHKPRVDAWDRLDQLPRRTAEHFLMIDPNSSTDRSCFVTIRRAKNRPSGVETAQASSGPESSSSISG